MTTPGCTRFAARRNALAGVFASLMLAASGAHAVLGGNESSIAADRMRLKAAGRMTAMSTPTSIRIHEMSLSDGSSVREYVDATGVVFAVAWSTRLKPRLKPLLGDHALRYEAAAGAIAAKAGIRRNVTVESHDLVVHSAAHLNSYVGVAYLRSLVPAGINADALR
ncbi:MAG: DUF2844 domain-containing protein [Pseudolysinimonas sp.]